ncbi:MAG: TldD/PmbA family protein [bacterium]
MGKDVEGVLRKIVSSLQSRGAEFADARCISAASTTIEVQDGRLEKIHGSRSMGAGIRVLADGAWGFASSNGTAPDLIARCGDDALAIARAAAGKQKERGVVKPAPPHVGRSVTAAEIHPESVPIEKKVSLAVSLEKSAREYDPRVANTCLTYWDGSASMLVVNSFGTFVESLSVRTRVAVSVTAADGDARQRAFEIVGGRGGFEIADCIAPARFGEAASARAVRMLYAAAPPSGKFPVIFDPSIAGLLVHEAFGHNSEADHVLSGESIISDKLGQRIASPLVTIVDDPTHPGAWGSFDYDAEGTPAVRRVLIENGVVKGLLHSLETAARMNAVPNGAARCESHHHRPIVRMSNTFFLPGNSTLEDMIKDIETGILLGKALSGYVQTEKGQFTCRAGESWLIRNGKKEKLLRDVSVSGLTLEALAKIDAVASDFALSMPGTCGKLGQGVPVDDGGPHIRVSELVVGGTGE